MESVKEKDKDELFQLNDLETEYKFRCKICGMRYKSQLYLSDHVRYKHIYMNSKHLSWYWHYNKSTIDQLTPSLPEHQVGDKFHEGEDIWIVL